MNLEDYVKMALLDITNAVASAQRESQLWIAPGAIEGQMRLEPQMIRFEVAVTVNADGSGGINVWTIGNLKADVSTQNTNRLTFEVPVYFQSPRDRPSPLAK